MSINRSNIQRQYSLNHGAFLRSFQEQRGGDQARRDSDIDFTYGTSWATYLAQFLSLSTDVKFTYHFS